VGVEGVFDPLADGIFLAADAMHIDASRMGTLVPARAATSAGAPLAFSHSDRAACRR
jgi:hypothetical protein